MLTLDYLKVILSQLLVKIMQSVKVMLVNFIISLPIPAKPLFSAFAGGMVEERSEIAYVRIPN